MPLFRWFSLAWASPGWIPMPEPPSCIAGAFSGDRALVFDVSGRVWTSEGGPWRVETLAEPPFEQVEVGFVAEKWRLNLGDVGYQSADGQRWSQESPVWLEAEPNEMWRCSEGRVWHREESEVVWVSRPSEAWAPIPLPRMEFWFQTEQGTSWQWSGGVRWVWRPALRVPRRASAWEAVRLPGTVERTTSPLDRALSALDEEERRAIRQVLVP